MDEQKKTKKFIITIVIFSVLAGLLFSLLFAWFTGDPFKQVVIIGFWFGPVMGIMITILKFTRGKTVEETFSYDGNVEYLSRMKSILKRLKYKLQNEEGINSEWKYDGSELDLTLSDNVYVKSKDNTISVTGPKIVIKKLKEYLNK